jgi:hypothetical protein
MRATWTVLMLCACYEAPSDAPEVKAESTASQPQQATPPPVADSPHIVCDMAKFSFTQSVGCVNDGWVEFCADKKGGASVLTALRSIAPDVSIQEGVIGHAGCNEATEFFVNQPLHDSDCTQHLGALTDAAWNTLCALSQVPETKHFVPGFSQ